ncbi:MAG: polysaccharide deacetylase family protein [Gemmatimonadetes bacterium]|nr:polysaccharide deacetylase family protein [Gemmatimonadota bacterium]
MSERWVCLLYHDVTGNATAAGSGDYFSVPADAFASQLDWIRDTGHAGCSLEEGLRYGGRPRVVISFDDGNTGQYERAFQALAARGMSATFFVTTDWVGRPGYVTWEQLREMKAAGMSIQSHTRSHPFLSELDRSVVLDELRGSKETLDQALCQATESIALPGGDLPPPAARQVFREAGYAIVATSLWGVNHIPGPAVPLPLYVRRCTMRGAPGEAEFGRVLAGDRWLAIKRRAREAALGALRSSLGASRYAAWRRRFLDATGSRAEGSPA